MTTQSKLTLMSIEQLLRQFVEICLNQDKALLYSDTRKYNRLFDQLAALVEELKRRPGDGRRALVSLYDHANAQVRLQAAECTLAVAPSAARRLIEEIANSKKYPQAGYAGVTLDGLESGDYKPS